MRRRRFLTITAAALAAGPAAASPARWDGIAFGGEVSVTIRGGRGAEAALHALVGDLRRIEARFSLFRSDSDIARLNRDGAIAMDADWRAMVGHVDRLHRATGGVFDPTIQPLWRLMARTGGAPAPEAWRAARARTGWHRVRHDGDMLRLAPGQALTLNGIAQGLASDIVADRLADAGFGDVLVNLGEYRAGADGTWRLGIAGMPDRATLRGDALAVSEPGAMMLGRGRGHIFDATGTGPRPARWARVAVQAEGAAVADGLSTAFALMSPDAIRRTGLARRVLVQDAAGTVLRI